jgi:hypothetical protein
MFKKHKGKKKEKHSNQTDHITSTSFIDMKHNIVGLRDDNTLQ